MTPAELLLDGFERVRDNVAAILEGLDVEQLRWRAGPEANPIGWLVWHLTRVQDDHVAEVAGTEQVYPAYVDRFALPYPVADHGYGHTSGDVAAFAAEATLLAEYHDRVHARTRDFLATVGEHDLDRVVDTRWDPPVTLGVRLVSVLDDDAQHVGQAAYVRGLLGV